MNEVIGKQLLRSGTSVGANYREACKARSTTEFVSKIGIALQELEESKYWLELLDKSKAIPSNRLIDIRKETEELIAIFVSSANTAKKRKFHH